MMTETKNFTFKPKLIFLMLLVFTSINIHAQDDDGPAPPPPTAPINSWIPAFITIAIIIGGVTLVKSKKKLDN